MKNLNVMEIVKEYLLENEYSGLFADECGCAIDNLFTCGGEVIGECRAGYKIPCTCWEKHDFHIARSL